MKSRTVGLLACLLIVGFAAPAMAYVGPGAGITLIGSVIGVLIAIVAAIGVVIAWPIRRMLKARKAQAQETESAAVEGGTDTTD